MKTRFIADPVRYRTMTTTQIRETFLIDNLCVPGEIHQVYIDLDRAVVGMAEMCNRRTVCKYIYLDGARSCQLVMGVTHLHSGSAWNTMPAHTHMRRSEIYMYFNLPEQARVFHLMGFAEETRHIVMKD